MIVSKKLIPALKKTMFSATAVLALMQCSPEEELAAPATTNAAIETVSDATPVSISSLTVTGANTAFATLNDCKTCTYVVKADEEIIDGSKYGFKPGSVICLNKGIKYGNLEFINIDGSVEQPIIIATIGEAKPISIAAEDEYSISESY